LQLSAVENVAIAERQEEHVAIEKPKILKKKKKKSVNGKTVIFDVAHNPQAMENLVKSLKKEKLKKPVSVIFGIMDDKDIKETIKFLIPAAENIFCFTPSTKRAQVADYLAQDFRDLGAKNVFVCKSAKEAFEKAVSTGETVLAGGSFYLIPEIMTVAGIENYE
jgi:dihydrofolate synthase/folylpolyglutamate synthase